jgi:hypothetical protein
LDDRTTSWISDVNIVEYLLKLVFIDFEKIEADDITTYRILLVASVVRWFNKCKQHESRRSFVSFFGNVSLPKTPSLFSESMNVDALD